MESPPKVDAKSYYGYLFDDSKRPTQAMDALLRGIADYIVESVGDKEDKTLSPGKLAAFYKAVGGNYDSLFVDVPYPSISYIYQSIGCSHSLQPSEDDFAAPSIPSLTRRGFVRWQSIETLLDPEEHVSFLQKAVRNFPLKHPDNGKPFPVDLPADSLPKTADSDIVKWHNLCAEKLRQYATPDGLDDPILRPTLPPRSTLRARHEHLRNRSTPGRSTREREEGADYFNSKLLPRPRNSRDSTYHTYLTPHEDSPRNSRSRRRSVPENYYSPSPTASPSAPGLNEQPVTSSKAAEEERPGIHVHHHHHSSTSSSSSGDKIDTAKNLYSPRRTSVENGADSTPAIRYSVHAPTANSNFPFSYPSSHGPSHAPSPTSHQRHRGVSMPYSREKLAAYKIPIDLSGKLSAPFLRSAGMRHVEAGGRDVKSTSNSRSSSNTRAPPSGVRWGVNEVAHIRRRNSNVTMESQSDSDDTATNERDWDRRTKEGIVRPKLVQQRSGSHDGRYRVREFDHKDRDRDGDRDDQEPDRRRERRRVSSPDDKQGRRHVDRPDGWM